MALVERSEQLPAVAGYVDEARAGHGRLAYGSAIDVLTGVGPTSELGPGQQLANLGGGSAEHG